MDGYWSKQYHIWITIGPNNGKVHTRIGPQSDDLKSIHQITDCGTRYNKEKVSKETQKLAKLDSKECS